MNRNRTTSLTLILALLLLCCFQLQSAVWLGDYAGFETLQWQTLEGCAPRAVPHRLPEWKGATGNYRPETVRPVATLCRSKPVALRAQALELEFASRGAPLTLRVLDAAGSELFREPLGRGIERELNTWARQRVLLDAPVDSGPVTLELAGAAAKGQWASVRNKIHFYEPAVLESVSNTIRTEILWWIIPLLTAAVVTALVLPLGRITSAVWFAGAAAAAAVHFRPQVFFYYDEWHVLERFGALGARGVIYTHNEHFLPLFFGIYYLEALLFGDGYLAYILLGIILHAVNAALVVVLLRGLSGSDELSRAAPLLGALFLFNALHAEALQWAFELSLIASHLVLLLSLLLAIRYLGAGGSARLAVGAALAASAPLFFGNGFSLAFYLPIVLWISYGTALPESRHALRRRAASLFVAYGAGLAVAAALYVVFREGGGHSIEQARPLDDPLALLGYLFVGTQLGTVLRGLGAYPSLSPGSAARLLDTASPEIWLACGGLTLTVLAAVAAFFPKQDRAGARLWLGGFLWLGASLLLPALGRWHYGALQSLSLRYHYGALIGLLLMLLPVTARLLHGGARGRFVLFAAATLSLASNLALGRSFDYFTAHGLRDRRYAAELTGWQSKMSALDAPEASASNGAGTPFYRLAPIFPGGITPGRGPADIYRVLHWLDPERYPSYERGSAGATSSGIQATTSSASLR